MTLTTLFHLQSTLAMQVLMRLVFNLGYVITFSWCAYKVSILHDYPYGVMTLFLTLVTQLEGSIRSLGSIVPQFYSLMVSAKRLYQITALEHEAYTGPAPAPTAVSLRITDVGFHYEDEDDHRHVLRHLNFSIPAGSRVGIVGASGAGKTTFIRLLLSLLKPTDGTVEYVDENGQTRMKYGEIWLPEGKTPFVMSQDDVNYYGYMIGDVDPDYERPAVPHADGDGFAHKIIIGADGYPTCEYMDAEGNIHVGSYDLVPILEDFIQAHPDFSYRGARAILGMTGYEGVFGYRTKPAYEDDLGTEAYKKECEDAKAVAQCLKDHGWILASHSYGHPSYGNISAEKVASDSDKWEQTVQPIIGDCDIILYPNGSDIAGIGKYTFDNAKFAALYEDGYRYFYNVDSHVAWQQLGEDYFRGGRRNLDGYRMWYTPKKVADLFNVDEVFDPDRPTPVPSI